MYALEPQYALKLVSPHHISKQVSHNIFIYPPYALERYDFKPSLVLHQEGEKWSKWLSTTFPARQR